MEYNVTTDEFRNLTQLQQVLEVEEYVIQYCQQRDLEINFKNAKAAFAQFEEKVSETTYLEDQVLNRLEIETMAIEIKYDDYESGADSVQGAFDAIDRVIANFGATLDKISVKQTLGKYSTSQTAAEFTEENATDPMGDWHGRNE